MTGPSAIVFGPTGSIGSIAAITAQKNGARVTLAMRDISKPIPGLSSEEEEKHGFTRVTADLTKPDTVSTAVKQSGAKRAFMYAAHGMSDHMKSTIEAMKSAGIEFVVFLSSYTIIGEPASVPPQEIIPFMHAQVEIQLENIFGPKGYAAVRPGAFATNSHVWWGEQIKKGEVREFGPDVKFDFTAPEDMGGVAGTVLANGPKDGQKIVYVYGPQFIAQEEALKILLGHLSKDVKITHVAKDAWIQDRVDSGWPGVIANYLANKVEDYAAHPEHGKYQGYEEGVENVQKYLGRPGVSFQEWCAKNSASFM